ncbi:hypothetical protein C8A05DRAFT_43374 [Staphylotrichum tortipilum]|uniref:Rhodopsin domain-containing protein n=1 Tax=Staphylotrichum tortipilum TaxID=2831512 RepID=A0AAN6MNW3_9PEZI|nr:hypothetical protein C8A05DRAFT_43374 [Staphylotrichum longicolle]
MSSSTESRAAQLAGVNIAALVLATVVTGLRCFVRVRLLKAFGTDDWLMVSAALCFACYCSFSLSGVANGTGQHVENLSRESYATARKWWWYCYPSYAVTMTLTKLSITFFFRRIIVERVHKWILGITMATSIISCTVFFFACIFQCWPVSYFWNKYSQTGTCIPDQVVIALALLFSAINIITDFTFALMPAWIISHLAIRRKTKWALSLLMGLGCVASTAVVVRLPYMRLLASDDFLYDTVDVAIWSTVEQGMAITAGGLATLQPLLKIIAFKLGLRSHPSAPNNPSNYGNKIRLQENGISVRRSFTHKTEPFSPSHKTADDDQEALNLQPGAAGYSAMCYNTSQELLAIPTTGSDGDQPKDLEAGVASRDERDGIPAAYMPRSPPRLARFRSGNGS